MRRRVSGHTAPKTASSASVGLSCRRRTCTSTTHQAPPSRSNNSMAGVSFNAIAISSPIPPSSVSLRRSALAQRSSSMARPGAFTSMGSVCGARYGGAFQRAPLRTASSRNTKPRTPSACFPTMTYETAESVSKRVAAAERTQLAATVTKHVTYGGRSFDCFADSAARCRGTQSTSFSRAVNVADKAIRLSRELTTVDSRSLDVDGTNDSRRPVSWSSLENLRGHQAPMTRPIDIRPVSIHPIQHKSPQPPVLSVSSQSKIKSEWASDLRPLESSVSESLSSVHRPRSSEYRALWRNASFSPGRRAMESRKSASTSPGTFSLKAQGALTERPNLSGVVPSDTRPIAAKPSLQKPVHVFNDRPLQVPLTQPELSILSPSQLTPLNSGAIESKRDMMTSMQGFKHQLNQSVCSPPTLSSMTLSQETPLNSRSIFAREPMQTTLLKGKSGSLQPLPSQSSLLSTETRLSNALDSQYSRDLIQFSGSKSIESAVVMLKPPEATSISSKFPDVPLAEIKASSPRQASESKQGQLIEVKSSVPLGLQLVLSPPAPADLKDEKRSINTRSVLQTQEKKAWELRSPTTKPLQLRSSSLISLEQQTSQLNSITPLSPASPPNAQSNFGKRTTDLTSTLVPLKTLSSPHTPFGLEPLMSSPISNPILPLVTDHQLQSAVTESTARALSSKSATPEQRMTSLHTSMHSSSQSSATRSLTSPKATEIDKPSTLRYVDMEPGQTNAAANSTQLPCVPKMYSNINAPATSSRKIKAKAASYSSHKKQTNRCENPSPGLTLPLENQTEKFSNRGEMQYEPEIQAIHLVPKEANSQAPVNLSEGHSGSPAACSLHNEEVPSRHGGPSFEHRVSDTQDSPTPENHLHSNSAVTSPTQQKLPAFKVYESKSSDVLRNNTESCQIFSTHENTTERFRRYSLRQPILTETISEASEVQRPVGANDDFSGAQAELHSSSTVVVPQTFSSVERRLKSVDSRLTREHRTLSSVASPPFYSFVSDETSSEIPAKQTQLVSRPLSSSRYKEYTFPPAEEASPTEPCSLQPISPHPVDVNSNLASRGKTPRLLSRVNIFGSFELTDENEPDRVPATRNQFEPYVARTSESTSDRTELAVKPESEQKPTGPRAERARSLEFPSLESKACDLASRRSGHVDRSFPSLVPLDLNSVKAYSSKEGSSMSILLKVDLLKLLETSGGMDASAKPGSRDVLLGSKKNQKDANTLPSNTNIHGCRWPKPGYQCYSSSSTSIDSEHSVV
ncbi:uncharacterized protein LOC144124777 [Amblyomma americanum]